MDTKEKVITVLEQYKKVKDKVNKIRVDLDEAEKELKAATQDAARQIRHYKGPKGRVYYKKQLYSVSLSQVEGSTPLRLHVENADFDLLES